MAYLRSARFADTLCVLFLAVITFALSRYIRTKYIDRRIDSAWHQTVSVVYETVTTLLMLVFVLVGLAVNGVDIGKAVTNLGLLGIILSFALQDLLKDFIMGITINMDGYFKVGDVVNYNGHIGKVISFNLKTTRLYLEETGEILSVGNRNISEVSLVADFVDIHIPIGYDIDLHFARELCRECARRIERLRYVYSSDFLNTHSLEESWIEYLVRVHCLPERKIAVQRNATAVVQDIFYEHGVPFPYSVKVLYNAAANPKPLAAADFKPNAAAPVDEPKSPYEFGHGAVCSKTVKFDGTDESLVQAVEEAARYADSENLSKKTRFLIRLLSEELLTLIKGMENVRDAEFLVERRDADYELVFRANETITLDQQGVLISVASSGKNDAYTGIGGILRHVMDSMMNISLKRTDGDAEPDPMNATIGRSSDGLQWSYRVYQEQEEEHEHPTPSFDGGDVPQDAISKSMLANLSDDIKISIRNNHFMIRVLVRSDDVDD